MDRLRITGLLLLLWFPCMSAFSPGQSPRHATTRLFAEDSLQKRLRQLQESEQRQEALQYRNWDLGNWNQESLDVKYPIHSVCHSEFSIFLGDSCGRLLQLGVSTPPAIETVWNVTTAAISALAYVEEEESIVCVAQDGIRMIRLDEEEESSTVEALQGADSSEIQNVFILERGNHWWLMTIRQTTAQLYALNDKQLAEVAAMDVTGSSFQEINDATITSCTFDASRRRLYLGFDNGYVSTYKVNFESSTPQWEFMARWNINNKDIPITAIEIGQDVLVNARQEMTVMFTGDASGNLQQWFLHGERIWPQMATQRLPNRAHVFAAHTDTVSSIANIDAVHFVSCSTDGTVRAWNAKSGQERFVLTGFETTPHMLVWENVLVTVDGKSIALHQFHVDTPEDFDLEMPEYRS